MKPPAWRFAARALAWSELAGTVAILGSSARITDATAGGISQRFYRVEAFGVLWLGPVGRSSLTLLPALPTVR